MQAEKHCDEVDTSLKIETETSNRIADSIVDSLVFTSDTTVASPVPDYDNVVDLILRLKAIVYPVFCAVEHSREVVRERLRIEVSDVGEALYQLVRRCILRDAQSCIAMKQHGCEEADAIERSKQLIENLDEHSRHFTQKFLETLPAIRESLMKDVQAAYDGDPACRNFDEVILCYPGLNAVTIHRMAHELYLLDVPFLPRMMAEWSHSETGIDIHPGATIGDYFFIDHGTGVVIGETCEIGKNVKIYQGVTLGALSFDKDERGELVRGTKRHPTLEDNVIIYANATVLGGRTVVGDGSIIGSSVWITRSVSPGTTVTMKTPSLRMKNQQPDDSEGLIDYQI
ncbi:serine O-acetyltransferase EpsC [Mariniblastus fucicola]|nr:serine O-acetyltransferase EpsC [Mariniblastus fucicola]